MKERERTLAIKLRRDGKSYSEILVQVPVAKSTLSEWFKSVQLAVPQVQRNTQLRIDAALRGAHSRRNKRLAEMSDLVVKGIEDVGKLSPRELWLIGTALYWAEGSKQKESNPSTPVIFTNSDPGMLTVFLAWLKLLGIPDSDVSFELYVHENRTSEIHEFKEWWATQLKTPIGKFATVYFKRDKVMTNRKNIQDLYHGILRIRVRTSTVLSRRINGWVEGIVQQ